MFKGELNKERKFDKSWLAGALRGRARRTYGASAQVRVAASKEQRRLRRQPLAPSSEQGLREGPCAELVLEPVEEHALEALSQEQVRLLLHLRRRKVGHWTMDMSHWASRGSAPRYEGAGT